MPPYFADKEDKKEEEDEDPGYPQQSEIRPQNSSILVLSALL